MAVESQRIEDFRLTKEPYYLPLGNEVELFEAAYRAGLPVMLKGPTGCGKTRFVEHMAWRLERTLVTVACHEDLTASDLVGQVHPARRRDGLAGRPADHRGQGRRHRLPGRGRRGPQGHHRGHPPAHRRPAHPAPGEEGRDGGRAGRVPAGHLLQPGLPVGAEGPQALDQAALRGASTSTTRRRTLEETILKSESGVDDDIAAKLVKIAEKVRNLRTHGLEEGVSTRLLVYAGQLIRPRVEPIAACEATICKPITDDLEMQRSIVEIIATQF